MARIAQGLVYLLVLSTIPTATGCLLLLGVEEEKDRPPPDAPTLCEPGSETSCYSGLEGTEGVGICAGGMMTCNAQGFGYGSCAGQVTPGIEDCAKPEDEDCSGLACAQPLWSKLFGDAGDQRVSAMAVDAAGAVYVTGSFAGTINLGGQTLTSAAGTGGFLAKLDAQGNHVWIRPFQGASGHVSLAVDADGNLIAAGRSASIQIDAVDLSTTDDLVFVVKLDQDGHAVWGRGFDGANPQDYKGEYIGGVATDSAGDVAIIGWFSGEVDFGFGTLVAQGTDTILMKLTVWARSIGPKLAQVPQLDSGRIFPDLTVDAKSNIIMAGGATTGADLGGGSLAIAGDYGAFVAKFSPEGTYLASAVYGGQAGAVATAVAADSNQNTIVAGLFQEFVDFGAGGTLSGAGWNLFLLKMDPRGVGVWSKGFSSGQQVYGDVIDDVSVAMGSAHISAAGSVAGSIDLGTGTLVGNGGRDAFVAEFAP